MTALKGVLTPKIIGMIVLGIIALGLLDHFTGSGVLAWLGEQIADKAR